MIGNDIIDLHAAALESNPARPGWARKVFDAAEQALINESSAAVEMCWLLWSMKEAAYKICNRLSGKSFYAPARFICEGLVHDGNSRSGVVIFENHMWFTRSTFTNAYLHTVATTDAGTIPEINIQPATAPRQSLLPAGYSFVKQRGMPPSLVETSGKNQLPVSYSDHGSWQAIAFLP